MTTPKPAVRKRPPVPRRLLATVASAFVALALIVVGIALIYPPAGMVAAGVALLALLTFNPNKVGRVTWPR